MSPGYENYSKTSSTYDDHRVAVGMHIIRRALDAAGDAAGDVRLLDAGCGTGSYLAALQGNATTLVGLEPDLGMLERASRKLETDARVAVLRGSALSMPFQDGEFGLVMFNQVLHHLDGEQGANDGWPSLRQALRESRRVLRRDGQLLINTCTQQQLREGFWYAPLIPRAIDRVARRYVPVAELVGILDELGFNVVDQQVPPGDVFYGARALDPTGPFDEAWRNGDSVWALTTPDELQSALARLRNMLDAGEAEAFVAERERMRRGVGQCVFVQARRGAAAG